MPEKWLKQIAPKYKIGILKEIQYTLEEVQAHTNMDGQDNWLVVDGYVYDVTLCIFIIFISISITN